MNTTTIAHLPGGRVLVTVALANGTTDVVEAYDMEAAISFSHMLLAGQQAEDRTRPYYA